MQKILIIQTAFIGDVILATALLEKLHSHFPTTRLDFLLRKGNEGLLENHPFIGKIHIWDKKSKKYQNLWKIISKIRKENYDLVVNLQRFFSTGLITTLSKGKSKVGFNKNPLSIFFTHQKKHEIGSGTHEVERNLQLIEDWTDTSFIKPKLYPSELNFLKIEQLLKNYSPNYICIAPTSVWFTKQFPAEKWVELINGLSEDTNIFLLGGTADREACKAILVASNRKKVVNLAGELSFLESAALMKGAKMNYVNDSAPLHICSAMNAPVIAIFCSTIPAFGFTPVSENSKIVETKLKLACRPCGLHGRKACPEGHFKCAKIDIEDLKIEE